MNAVIYARYSAGPRQTEQSIEGQVRECRAFADTHDLVITGIYADSHISGKTDERPEFQRLIKDARARKFEAVIVYKTDRFARNRYDSAIYKRELKKAGCKIYYACEPMAEGPEGVLMESLLEGMAEYYSLELAQKVKRGMNENALKAKSNGGNRTFGYMTGPDRSIIINEDEAFYVREIFRRRAAGESTSEIAAWLNSRGVKTTRGNNFSTEALNRLIRTRKYLGEYKYSNVIKKDAIPAIIDPETWEKAQSEGPSHKKQSPEYRLNGKVFCGLCGSPLHGVSGTGKSGKTWYYYTCAEYRKKACELKPVRADWLEDQVLKATREYVFREDVLADLVEKIYNLSEKDLAEEERPVIEKRLREIDSALDKTVDLLLTDAPREPLIKKMQDLDLEKKALETRLWEIQPSPDKLTREQIDFALRFFAEKNDKMLLTKFVAKVEVWPDRLVIYYNIGGPDGGLRNSTIEFDDPGLCSTIVISVEHGYLKICVPR